MTVRLLAFDYDGTAAIDGQLPSGRVRAAVDAARAQGVHVVQGVNRFQCPSETTSTVPSVTLMAVSSSIA
jgi:hypothetical protein